MSYDDTVWYDQANKMLLRYGYAVSRRKLITARDSNSPGTVSYAFHNATLKALEKIKKQADA